MLVIAEQFQQRCDALNFRIQVIGLGGVIMMVSAVTIGVYFGSSAQWIRAAGFALAGLFISGSTLGMAQAQPKRQLARDKRALGEIVQLLRETEAGLMYQGMTPFELAQIRIRLSRFDIA